LSPEILFGKSKEERKKEILQIIKMIKENRLLFTEIVKENVQKMKINPTALANLKIAKVVKQYLNKS